MVMYTFQYLLALLHLKEIIAPQEFGSMIHHHVVIQQRQFASASLKTKID